MLEFRLSRCRDILSHAGTNVPYYRELFRQHRFDPASFASFEDFQKLPVLSRDIVIDSFSRLESERHGPSDVTTMRTGGTTGKPVKVLLEKRNAVERMMVTHRLYALMGRTLGSPTLLVSGNAIDFHAWTAGRDRLKNLLMNVTVRPSFDLTPDKLVTLLDEIARGKHRFLIAYSSVFDILSSLVESRGAKIAFPKLIPTAELITSAQRSRWAETLGAEIFELYGSREMVALAGETHDHQGLVISGDIYHVEITDEAGRLLPHGTPGLITVTSLIERAMPLIRYQLGDAGVMTEAPAESPNPFPRLRITHGRVLDVIVCPDGKVLPGEFFPHLMKEASDQISRFQVVQTEPNRLCVRIVPTGSYTDRMTSYLTDKIRKQVGADMRIEFELVDRIETSGSGKYRPTINLVPPEQRTNRWR